MLGNMANQRDVNSSGTPREQVPAAHVGRVERLSESSEPMGAASAVTMPSRDELLLARTRALMQLQTACAPAHRGSLERTIANIDAQLAER